MFFLKKYPVCFILTWASFLMASCQGTGSQEPANLPQQVSSAACDQPRKIAPIYREQVYDLSGYSDGSGDPYNLFDENAFVDPRTGAGSGMGYHPSTSPQPTHNASLYYPLGKGNRIVTDLKIPYRLTEVYLYDRSAQPDSVWIYSGDPLHWKLKAAFLSGSNPGYGGWKKVTLQDSSRFLMVRFSSFQTDITEMVLYGCPLAPLPDPPPAQYAGHRLPAKKMKDFLGVNFVMEYELQWLKPFHYNRLYNFTLDFDNDTVHAYPEMLFNMLHYGYWDEGSRQYHFNVDDIKASNQSEVWFSLRGVPRWMANKGFTERDRPVTLPGMDPEDPMSYGRHAQYMWNMAAFFGSQATDTGRMRIVNRPRRSGRGTMDLFENGNEEDAWWVGNRYCNPLAYFAQSSADYDGHEGRLGFDAGIRNADSLGLLMTSGMTELDTNRVRTYKFLCDNLRNDHQFIWQGGIQYHHYSSDGKHGLTPEEDSLRWRLSRVRDATYRAAPGVPCLLGENGYDKSPLSPQGAPAIPGHTPGDCQGIFLLRSINATAFSGFDAYVLFWLRDEGAPDDPHRFATCGIVGPRQSGSKPYPAWFYISTFAAQLGDYSADSIISEKGPVWIYRYRHQDQPDSVAYLLYSPTRDGRTIRNFSFQPAATVADSWGRLVRFSDQHPQGTSSSIQIKKGGTVMDIEEKPVLLFLNEPRK